MVRKEARFLFQNGFKQLYQRRILTTDEVINVADDDSSDEFSESLSQSEVKETSSNEETNTSVTTDTNATNER